MGSSPEAASAWGGALTWSAWLLSARPRLSSELTSFIPQVRSWSSFTMGMGGRLMGGNGHSESAQVVTGEIREERLD